MIEIKRSHLLFSTFFLFLFCFVLFVGFLKVFYLNYCLCMYVFFTNYHQRTIRDVTWRDESSHCGTFHLGIFEYSAHCLSLISL